VDLDVITVNSRALIARARAAHPEVDWDDTAPTPTATALQLGTAATPEPSRDVSVPGRGQHPKKQDAPSAQPLRLTRKKALALLDTAELVKDEKHRENNTWHLVAADGTVIGHIAPSYGGASRSGRNGWHGWAHGTTRNQERHPTRDAAAVAASGAWLQAVTAKPHR
jgi:hypothetical protein